MTEKLYVDAQKLFDDSFNLAFNIFESGYKPDWIVGVWRGGTPIGIAIQELLEHLGIQTDHISIRTSSYNGIDEQSNNIRVHGLGYIVKKINSEDSLLIVDDVYDTGLSMQQVIKNIRKYCRKNTPDIKIATPYFKPKKNKTNVIPDYYLYETDKWIVFPHEINGLTYKEIIENKPYIGSRFLANKKLYSNKYIK